LATTDARVHCAVLKIRAVPASWPPRAPQANRLPLEVRRRRCRGVVRRDAGPDRGSSNARSLRTQQRARPVRSVELAFLPQAGVLTTRLGTRTE